jgi:hypothetical protein
MRSIAATWGSTARERAVHFPCDAHLEGANQVLFRAVTVRAPHDVVFRWLCQLKIAPYSYDWIDNWGRMSPRVLTPGAESLARGQTVMTIFELVDFSQDEHLTLVLRRATSLFGRVALSYVVRPLANGDTRLIVKLRVEHGWGPLARIRAALLAWGDWVMMRKQLLTLKRLAEGSAHVRRPSTSDREHAGLATPVASWVVYRQDDNGNRFEVRSCASRDEAFEVARELETRGHKQLYWVERRVKG